MRLVGGGNKTVIKMAHTQTCSQRWTTLAILTAMLVTVSRAALEITYCSPDNNAGLNQPMRDQYQSTGLCGDHCTGSFAFAVIQGDTCWCSNYVPADQVDTSDCNSGCPGIDTEWCGNPDEGLYGYFQLPLGSPLGTSGGSGSPASSTSSSSSSSSSSSQTTTSAPEVLTAVTTVTGRVSTILVTTAPTSSADETLGQSSSGGGRGVDAGRVAGIVVGVVLGLALIGGLIAFFLIKRRRRNRAPSPESSFVAERAGGSSGNQSNSLPSRQVSQMSQAGLLGGKAPRLQTVGLGGGFGWDPKSAEPSSSNFDRRSVATDQRLNPSAIYTQDDRMSSVSLQDDRDYSRTLRVANPDT